MAIKDEALVRALRTLDALGAKYKSNTEANKAIKDEALVSALRTLDALEAKYKVISATGEEYGELEVAQVEPLKPRNTFKNLGYVDVVAALRVGDVAKLPLPSGMSFENAEKYRGSVASKGCQLWGKGNTMTAWADDKQAIEILRIM